MSTLTDISQEVAAVVAAASPSVVAVGPTGSGVIVGEGLVLTNAHNLRGEVAVTFADGRAVPASVAGADIDGDLAVLSVDTGGVAALAWSGPPAALGQLVIGLSRPGGGAVRAGIGFISGLDLAFRGPEGRPVRGALEHTAPLARGSSGGPVLDADGRLVGINTHRPGEGTYLALPASAELQARVDALAQGQAPRRVRLGVALAPTKVARRLRQAVGLPDREGALVHDIDDAGPAARSGVRRGDLIVSVAGRPVTGVDDLTSALAQAEEGAPVSLVVVRGVEEVLVDVHFDNGPAAGEEGTA